MTIKHDDQGFLIGHRVENSDVLDLLEAIRSEIKALRGDFKNKKPASVPRSGRQDEGGSAEPSGVVAAAANSGKAGEASASLPPRQSDSASQSQAVPSIPSGASKPELQASGPVTTNNSVENNNYSDRASSSIVIDRSTDSTIERNSSAATTASSKVDQLSSVSNALAGKEASVAASAKAQPVVASKAPAAPPMAVSGGNAETGSKPGTGDVKKPDSHATSVNSKSESNDVSVVVSVAAAVKPGTKVAGKRDEKGRFIKGSSASLPSSGRAGSSASGGVGGGGGDGGESPLASSQKMREAISGVGDKITGVVGALPFNEESDPSVKAFNEVAKPLQRGFGKIFGGKENDANERWYRRFWRHMRLRQKTDKKQHKEQVEILEDIEKKDGGSGGGGFLGVFAPLLALLGTLLKSLIPLKLLGFLKFLPGLGGKGKGLAAAAGGVKPVGRLGALLGRGGAAAKGVTRRLPIVGSLIAALTIASGVRASETDQSTTRREKDTNTGSAIGSGAGVLSGAMVGGSAGGSAGAAIGTLIFPGLGTAVGGVLGSLIGAVGGAFLGESAGDIIGAKVGELVSDIRESDIARTIISTWNVTTDFAGHLWSQASAEVSERWSVVTDSVSSIWSTTAESVATGWDSVSGKFAAAADSISESWGAALKSMKAAWGKVTKLASEWWGSVSEAADKANEWIKETTGVDIKAAATSVSNSVTDTYESTKSAVNSAVQSAGGWVTRQAKRAADATGVTGAVQAVKRSASHAAGKEALRQAMAEAGITDPNEMASFMGQMDHESSGFTSLDESFNYRSADRVMAVSKTARNKGPEAVNQAMQQGPEAVAELMYSGRMGNVNEGDGYAFRGRGFTQLTGRDNYTKAGEALGLDLANNPDLASDPAVAAKIATWYWQSRSGLSEAGKAGDIEGVTERINGGFNGLDDRKAKTAMYMQEALSGSLSVPAAKAKESVSSKETESIASTSTSTDTSVSASVGASATPVPAETTETAPTAGAISTAAAGGAPFSQASFSESLHSAGVSEPVVPLSLPAPLSQMASSAWMPSPVSTAVAASMSPVSARAPWSSVPRPPAVSEQPEVKFPLSSPVAGRDGKNGGSGNQEVSRDVSDRRIAHVVTGAHSQL